VYKVEKNMILIIKQQCSFYAASCLKKGLLISFFKLCFFKNIAFFEFFKIFVFF